MTTLRTRWAVVLAVTVLLRVPALIHPSAIDDEETYAVVATEMVDGGLPYADAIERKPPLLFWTYAAIFAVAGKYNWVALHVVGLAWVIATMWALAAVTRRLAGPSAGLAAALLYGMYQPWATFKNLPLNGEVLMNLPIALALLVAFRPSASRLRPELLGAGALLGAAFLLKQPAAVAAVPIGVYLWLPGYRAARRLGPWHSVLHAASLTVGFWGAIGAAALVLSRQGMLADAYFWTITHHDVPHGPTDPLFWQRGIETGLAFLAVCAPLVIGAAATVRRGAARAGEWSTRRPEFATLVGLLLMSAVGTAASGRFYPHYFIQLLVPLAILGGPALAPIFERPGALQGASARSAAEPALQRRDRRVLGIPREALLVWLGLTVAGFFTSYSIGLAPHRTPTQVGRYLLEHSEPGDRMFVWGHYPSIYLDARRRPASRYIATFPLTGYVFGSPLSRDPTYDTSHRIVPGAWQNLVQDFAEHPPAFIVDVEGVQPVPRYPLSMFPILHEMVTQRYEPVYRGAEGMVYKRK